MMSRSRDSQGLAGMHSLMQDGVTILGAQSACCHEVDRSSQQMLKVALQLEEPEQTHWVREIHEEINVAVAAGLAASRRSEESKGSDAKPGQIRSVPCQFREYCLALVHDESIVVMNSLAVKPSTVLPQTIRTNGTKTGTAVLGEGVWPLEPSLRSPAAREFASANAYPAGYERVLLRRTSPRALGFSPRTPNQKPPGTSCVPGATCSGGGMAAAGVVRSDLRLLGEFASRTPVVLWLRLSSRLGVCSCKRVPCGVRTSSPAENVATGLGVLTPHSQPEALGRDDP